MELVKILITSLLSIVVQVCAVIFDMSYPEETHQNANKYFDIRSPVISKTITVEYRARENNEIVYLAKISLGTPPQNFTVLLDTGSPILCVPSVDASSESFSTLNKYDQSKLQTYEDGADDLQTEYVGEVKLSGPLSIDVLKIGGVDLPGFKFMQAKEGSNTAKISDLADGILGLPSGVDGRSLTHTIMDLMMEHCVIEHRIMTFDYCSSEAASLGSVTFGGTPAGVEFVYAPLAVGTSWYIKIKSVLHGESIIECCTILLLIDTGFEHLIFPKTAFTDIMKGLRNFWDYDDPFEVNCQHVEWFPPLIFTIDRDKAITLTGNQYITDRIENGQRRCFVIFNHPLDGSDMWVFGVRGLRHFQIAFDQDKRRVGFSTVSV